MEIICLKYQSLSELKLWCKDYKGHTHENFEEIKEAIKNIPSKDNQKLESSLKIDILYVKYVTQYIS